MRPVLPFLPPSADPSFPSPSRALTLRPATIVAHGEVTQTVLVPAGDPELTALTTIVTLGVTIFGAIYLADLVRAHRTSRLKKD